LCCRERFRIKVVEGLQPADSFRRALEFGNLWHCAEEAFAVSGNPIVDNPVAEPPWLRAVQKYAQGLCKRYPLQQEEIVHWMNVVMTQFPHYVQYWRKQPDVRERTPLLQEQAFNVPYRLPSGRVVRLRGKWDSVDLIGKGKNARLFLKENKSKGDINEQQLKRQLSSAMDLQTMLYSVALIQKRANYEWPEAPFGGVIYNVIRRPLSGGRGSIVRHKPTKSNPAGESAAEFYARLGGIIAAEPEYFFMRWKIELTPADVERFRRECLDPILEQLCDWWTCVNGGQVSPYSSDYQTFRMPYGIWSPILDGGETEVDEFLQSGSTLGLTRATNLFPELQ
jgi:hypothetical protein